MARPRARVKRDEQLNLSLTSDELGRLRARAEAVGMRLVDFGRLLLLTEQGGSIREILAVEKIGNHTRLIRLELQRLGNNLNQLTRRLNTLDEPPPETLEPLLREIRAIVNRDLRS